MIEAAISPTVRVYRRAQRRLARGLARRRLSPLYAIFFVFIAASFILLLASLFGVGLRLAVGDQTVLFAGLLTGAIIWWQGHLIRRLELETTVDLYREWNSKEVRRKRRAAWLDDKPDPERIEDVLEFLEKVSTFERERFISRALIWDTFGWYLWRYYFYCRDVIMEKRRAWTPGRTDATLYRDLELLHPKLVRMELAERNWIEKGGKRLTEGDVIRELEETRTKFIECERSSADD